MSLSSNFPAIKPSLLLDFANTKQLDPRVTFARATTATYYDGVTTALAEQNLFLQSQDFDNASWIKAFSTVTANATTAPDGTTTADLVVPNTTNNPHGLQFNVTTTGTTTISVYAKAGGYDRLVFSSNSNAYIYFNLTSGTVESTAGAGWSSPTITSVGSGWYRCVAVNSNSNTRYDILTYNALQSSGSVAPTFTGDGTSGVYLWGAQLEQRSSVTAYTATTTQAITNYIPVLMTAASGVPRFDHNPTTDESLGLLIEEQRTNLFTYSEQFDNAAWTKGAVSVTSNTIIAPDGSLTGDKLISDATSSVVHNIRQSVTSTGAITFSFYAKQGEYTKCGIREGAATGGYATFNLSTGVVIEQTVGTATITPVGNGWYRCTFTLTATNPRADFYPLPSAYTSGSPISYTYTGDGFSGIFLWGAQAEAGAFATSYIPTVASTVTRNADAASMTGTNFSSWFSSDQGTLYAEALPSAVPATDAIVRFVAAIYNALTYANAVRLERVSGSFRYVQTYQNSSNVTSASWATNTNAKVVAGYSASGNAASFNGATAASVTSQVPLGMVELAIGTNSAGGNNWCGTIKKIAYYPLRVTNAQLQALTS